MNSYNTPILFIIFNRYDTEIQVFNKIKDIKPKQLFIAADGPRENRKDDDEKCKKARSIIDLIDWDCEVKTLFREKNLGCGKGVSGAISWFFENVEKGIILEDDCIPNDDFFIYCQDLLERYKDDDRISVVSGTNNEMTSNTNYSYYYSVNAQIWGWATWKRVWNNYRYDINDFDKHVLKQKIKKYASTIGERILLNYRLSMISSNKVMEKRHVDTWDYQAYMSFLMKDYLAIIPQKCLISNVGFGEDATHTNNISESKTYETHSILPLIYNDEVKRDLDVDKAYYKKYTKKALWKYPLLYLWLFLEKYTFIK